MEKKEGRITKARAFTHVDRCHDVRDNCKYLPEHKKPIRSKWDKGAFTEYEDTVEIAIDGSSRLAEWISNALFWAVWIGIHFGFYKAAKQLFEDLNKKISQDFFDVKRWILDGHSRGGALVVVMAILIWWRYRHFPPHIWPEIQVVTSGAPVAITLKLLNILLGQKRKPFTVHALLTARDFVDNVNARRGSKLRLHHIVHERYQLKTVKGIDHLLSSYKKAITTSNSEMWGEFKW